MDMMDDGPSLVLFVGLIAAMVVIAVIVLPPVFRRLDLRRWVAGLAVVGPMMALIGGIIGTGTMTLSGHDFWYALAVAIAAAAASMIVGFRLAKPVAQDLAQIGATVEAVAAGDRESRTGIERADEIGKLAGAVDDLTRSLNRSEKERISADDERNAVVSALSHDLRTPLASLLASVDAVEDGVGDARSHLRAMRSNIMSLERLVSDLFLLAKADSGSLELSAENLDLAELVDDAIDAVGPVAARRSVKIGSSIDVPIPIYGDHTAFGRVFRNLLDNAIRHSPSGGTVWVDHHLEHGAVMVSVRDQGEGFPPHFVEKAFDRFTQADAARSGNGTAGLGLAIVSALITAHGGTVQVRSGPGGHIEVRIPSGGVRSDNITIKSARTVDPSGPIAPR